MTDESTTQKIERAVRQAQDAQPSWIQRHVTELAVTAIIGGLGTLALAGAMAYMDARHVQHVELIESEIQREDAEIQALEDYQRFVPDAKYAPARESIIQRRTARKEALERQLERLKK